MASHPQPWVRRITFTRPADTTQYTAGDGVSDATTTATVATFAVSGLSTVVDTGGIIKSVALYKSDQDLTNASFQVTFFDTQPVGTGFDDNAQLAITDTEWKRMLNFVQLTTTSDSSNMVTGDAFGKTNCDIPYAYVTGSSPIYVVVSALAAYTPASEEVFTLVIGGVQH